MLRRFRKLLLGAAFMTAAAGSYALESPQLDFHLLKAENAGDGNVESLGPNSARISIVNTDPNNYVIALASAECMVTAQDKFVFLVAGSPDNGEAQVSLTVAVERGGKWESFSSPGVKVTNTDPKKVIFSLDSDLRMGDAAWQIKQVKFVLNSAANPRDSRSEIVISDARFANAGEVAGSGQALVVVPGHREKRDWKINNITPKKVFFDFDNDDYNSEIISRVSQGKFRPDPNPTDGFRTQFLEFSDGIFELVRSPQEADVIVSSRTIPGEFAPAIAQAVTQQGKRLILYGKAVDPELAALAPMQLKAITVSGFPERVAPDAVSADAALFGGERLNAISFGKYFQVDTDASVLLCAQDGTPLIAQAGNVMQMNFGPGMALLASDVYYDKLALRAMALGDDASLQALDTREEQIKAERSQEELDIIARTLADAPAKYLNLQFSVGASHNNFGRFGFLVEEGLQCDQISRDLTHSNFNATYRFNVEETNRFPLLGWSREALEGEIVFRSGNENVDVMEEWEGLGKVRFTASFIPDPSWKDKELFFQVEDGIDDLDETFLNGVKIGETTQDVPQYWVAPRNYRMPQELLKYGEPNQIEVIVENTYSSSRFQSKPQIFCNTRSASVQPQLSVGAINWVSKQYDIVTGSGNYHATYSLLTPFAKYDFAEQNQLYLTLENVADFAAYHTAEGVKIVDMKAQPELFRAENGDLLWDEPWLLLFRKESGTPLLLVFQRQPESVTAQYRGEYLEGISIGAPSGQALQTIVSGWPWGIRAVNSSDWQNSLPEAVLIQIHQAVNMALNFPVGCDEIFSENGDKLTIVNRFSYAPIADEWNTKLYDWSTIPPLMQLAREKELLVASEEPLRDFQIDTMLGPLYGVNQATVSYELDAHFPATLIVPRIQGSEELNRQLNHLAVNAVNYSCGGRTPVDRWTPEYPAGKEFPIRNIDPFAWDFGLGPVLQGFFVADDEVRAKFQERVRNRFLYPLEFLQYKFFVRHREEPFSGLRYPISFNSFYASNTNYAPGFGTQVIYGDVNESTVLHLWIAEQLGNVFGQRELVRGAWPYLKQIARHNLYQMDYGFFTASCREFGVGAWLDMLNGEYAGMQVYAKLGLLCDDREAVKYGSYAAAKAAVPTIMRFDFTEYINRARPEIRTADIAINGFGESDWKSMRYPADNGNFLNATDYFDFSEGSTGELYHLYQKYAIGRIQRYFADKAVPSLLANDKNIMGPSYVGALANFGAQDDATLEAWALDTCQRFEASHTQDWPGIMDPAYFGFALHRIHHAPGIVFLFDTQIRDMQFDPVNKRLTLALQAHDASKLLLENTLPVKQMRRNGEVVTPTEFLGALELPLQKGEQEFVIQY